MKFLHKTNLAALPVLLLAGCAGSGTAEKESFTQFVDPMIGTGGHGHVFVGANVPFGFVQLGPTSISQEWDRVSGYHVSDSTVIGFPHTHLSGTGIGDLNDVTFMPVTGTVTYARGTEDSPESGLWSYSARSREVVRPGYYSTRLLRYNVDVELTATKRVGFHKYTYNNPDSAAIVIDLLNGGCWDRPVKTDITVLNDSTVSGCRYSKGWAWDQRVHFVARFSQPIVSSDTMRVESLGGNLYARLDFNAVKGKPIYAKVALSPVSVENALLNMDAELPGWDFDACVTAADDAWNRELSKIKVETDDVDEKRKFYTALYHTMVAPSEFCDVNGDYYGADQQIHRAAGFVNYTTFSCWDTYRAAHPLMTIIHPEKMKDMVNTFMGIYSQQGKLPVWHLMGCETNTMVGIPGVCILADAVMKGFAPDAELAYEALKQSAMLDERGMDLRKEFGYIPFDKMGESVAYDLEYAIADWAVAQVAKKLGHNDDYEYFMKRSKSYERLFDNSTGFIRGLGSDGKFHEPFNPVSSTHRKDDYCEGNAWQYTFLVPHDVEGLARCFGSKENMLAKLDSLFVADSKLEGGDISPDISGMIGQYAHGNEPGHHTVYLYTMLGKPGRTADLVRHIMKELYTTAPDGLAGNEDVGQMSAWYILSSLGFYQVEPAGGRYYFGSPLFDKATVSVGDKQFVVIAKNNSVDNRYIGSVALNGEPYTKPYIDFSDIAAGGTLEFQMSPNP